MGTRQLQSGVLFDISVDQRFSTGEDRGSQGTSGNLETILVVITAGRGQGTIGICWVETWDATKTLQCKKHPPTTKNCPAANVSKAKAEKLWFKQKDEQGFAGQTQGKIIF